MEKLKALAERGVAGEKENATVLLTRFMEKHGITEADLEDLKTQTYWIRYKTDWERRLIFQITYMHLGRGHAFGCVGAWSGRKRKEVGVECTPAQYIEIQADFEFYNAHLADEMDLFYSAFLHKNNLFPPPELAGSPKDNDDEAMDKERLIRMSLMMEGVEHHTRRKELAAGVPE